MRNATTTSDMSKPYSTQDKAIGIDFLDVPKETLQDTTEVTKLSANDLKNFLFSTKELGKDTNRVRWDDMIDKIDECYFEGIPQELKSIFEAQCETDLDVILTQGSSNKVREMVRVLTNILLKERPMFEPDPSGNDSEIEEQEIITATRYLEYVWDRGGLRKEINLLAKQAIRRNRGILRVSYSARKKDIVFDNVDAKKFWFDPTMGLKNSWWYAEEREITFYDLELSGLFSKNQLDKIRDELAVVATQDNKTRGSKTKDGYKGVTSVDGEYSGNQLADQKSTPITVFDFYVKIRKDGEEQWMLTTFLENRILIRKDNIGLDDFPYVFLTPEDEAKEEVHRAHSMNDVANASVVSNYMNYKVLSWIQTISDVTIITDEQVQIERSATPGIRQVKTSATGGAITQQPQIAPTPMVNQDVFFHLERMERTAENNYGVHPNILQGVNGNAPSNGPVAQTLLANDVQNTSPIAQSFGLFLGEVARKILYIASKTYTEHRVIQIEPTRGVLDTQKIIGEGVIDDENRGTIEANNIRPLRMFENVNVTIIPSSAYTDAAKQQQLATMLQVAPNLMQYIPKSKIIESFAHGSATQMMYEASREQQNEEAQNENPEIAMAEAENKAMSAGQQRAPQANENHAVHDRVHLIEEQYVLDQLRQSNSGEEAQQMQGILGIIRDHRRQHNELSQQQQQVEESAVGPSPSLVGYEEEGNNELDVQSVMTEDTIAPEETPS